MTVVTTKRRGRALLACGIVWAISIAPVAYAQRRAGREGGPPAPLQGAGVSPAELQQLFDAYVLLQAQRELQLTDEQYPQFLSRVRTLQDVRRRHQMERNRILGELRRLVQPRDVHPDEAIVKAQLKALDDLEARSAGETKRAMDDLYQVLDVAQQARFRLFEEQMERRKLDLLMRARQANRPRNPDQP